MKLHERMWDAPMGFIDLTPWRHFQVIWLVLLIFFFKIQKPSIINKNNLKTIKKFWVCDARRVGKNN